MHRTESSQPATAEQERLVREHLPLVHHVINDLRARIPRHVPVADLQSAATFGLYQAATTFDPTRGVPFDAWARQRMRGALLDELRSRDWAGRTVRGNVKAVQQVEDELSVELGRTPTDEEIAARAHLDPRRLHQVRADEHSSVLLNYDSVFSEAVEHEALADQDQDPTEHLLKQETRGYLIDAVVALPARLRRVIVGYYFEDLPMAILAEELQVTESRVSQMRAEAVAMLRDGINSQLEPEAVPEALLPNGRAAQRRSAYYAEVAAGSDYRTRLSADAAAISARLGAAAPAERPETASSEHDVAASA
jgi:RNA polymerase sigma factor for flagellar operon FliA